MKTLYKYYSDKIKSDYFDSPTLKLTSSGMLNDPFEKIVPQHLMNTTLDLYKDFNPDAAWLNLHEIFNKITYEMYIKSCGIVSFSETPRNNLMWSHYTNQHKGICIGYKSDMLAHNKTQHNRLPCNYSPIKINYDNRRFDKYTDIFNGSTLDEIRKSIITKALTTKSNDWIYEKEHRLIIPMEYCDKIIDIGDKCLIEAHKDHIVINNDKSFKLINDGTNYINVICERDDLLFLNNIKASDIESVYIGCQAEPYYRIEIINKIKESSHLDHIKIFDMKPHENEFEFIPHPI